jgi:hypothetical protein
MFTPKTSLISLRKSISLAAAAILLGGLPACSGVRDSLGLSKQAPDEFAVVSNAPLTLPPDFSLRPPTPGARRPQETPIREQAAETLFQDNQLAGTESTGELALLQQADALETDPNIRLVVDREFSLFVNERDDFFESLLFWREEQALGDAVDARAEQQRLQENAALGQAVTTGETPTIERKERALLEGIF